MKEKVFEWVKTHWRKILIGLVITFFVLFILLILIIGVPILIHTIFDIPAPRDWLEAEWDREDVLGYYGDVLGFLGTVVLSSLALWQNHVIKVEADKREKLLEKMEYDKNMPILNFYNSGHSGNCGKLNVTIENISDNPANEVTAEALVIKNPKGEIISESQKANPSFRALAGREKVVFVFENENTLDEIYKISFKLSYKDKFEKRHERIVFTKVNKKISNKDKYYSVEV